MSPSSLTAPARVPCLDQFADLALWEAELAADPIGVESALMRRLETVPDHRSSCGLRHPLVVVLTLTACATLAVDSQIRMGAAIGSRDVVVSNIRTPTSR